MAAEDNEMIICPLCGHSFKKQESKDKCEGCPLNKNNCGLIRCPNCGYEFPEIDDVSLIDKIKGYFKTDKDRNKKGGQ